MGVKDLLNNMLSEMSPSKNKLLYEHNTALLNIGIKAIEFIEKFGVYEEFASKLGVIELYGLDILKQMKTFNKDIKTNDDNLKCEDCPDSKGCKKKPILKKLIEIMESEDIHKRGEDIE